jgi:hypothetical protein
MELENGVGELIRLTNKTMTLSQRGKIHKWLAAPDVSVNLNYAYEKRANDTCIWFLDSKQFQHWRDTPRSFMGLYGIGEPEELFYLVVLVYVSNLTTFDTPMQLDVAKQY